MKNETRAWMDYAEENLSVAELVLSHGHFNACLYNTQQAVEKFLKAVIVERELELARTHNIVQLRNILSRADIETELSEEDCDLLDAVYMPSRYPEFGVVPDQPSGRETCEKCVGIARKVQGRILGHLESRGG